jgi:hypothetical protein
MEEQGEFGAWVRRCVRSGGHLPQRCGTLDTWQVSNIGSPVKVSEKIHR